MSIHKRVVSAALLAVAMAAAGAVRAEGASAQFAADMARSAPDGQVVGGKLFVGDGRTRMEMSQQGREVVRISDQKRGMEWLLFPADKTYLERSTPAKGATPAPATPSPEADPCVGLEGFTCRRIGLEDVNGRPAVKWEMSMTDKGQTLTATQWLDQQRGLPLKHVLPNGQTMELKLLGTETLNGRTAEKWEMTTGVPNQPPTSSMQWYDPELKLAVKEELRGGAVSELKNIHVGPQPDDLFKVPDGYTKKTLPQPAPPPGAPPMGTPAPAAPPAAAPAQSGGR
ncbi:hypothetical protein [uncultured Thiodictyon sp.]|uniref:hypothetical protein n=1 Tax=uncultured Thiodictyon sp. TaxID=1846217 RepID=UPI0025D9B0E4|nr:hypothetical protein [uncultured Thiodictyon sp.]